MAPSCDRMNFEATFKTCLFLSGSDLHARKYHEVEAGHQRQEGVEHPAGEAKFVPAGGADESAEAAELEVNSIALLKSQQTFQQTFYLREQVYKL